MPSFLPRNTPRPLGPARILQRQRGTVVKWNAEKGYGFLKAADRSRDVFLHIRAFPPGQLAPALGQVVSYEVFTDARGPRALQARIEGFAPGHLRAAREWRSTAALVFPALFLAAITGSAWSGFLPAWIGVIYVGMSFLTVLVYGWDKMKAQRDEWRTAESTLHALELLGGWPGALVAQRLFRHKNRKGLFQYVFWTIVALHLGGWAWLLTH